MEHTEISKEILDESWNIHSLRMREVFNYARHFIKEMCHHDTTWNKDAKFDSPLPPVESRIFDKREKCYVSISDFAANLGGNASLVRGGFLFAGIAMVP